MAAGSEQKTTRWTAPRVAWGLLMASFVLGVAAAAAYRGQLNTLVRANAFSTLLQEAEAAERVHDLPAAERLYLELVKRRRGDQNALAELARFYDTHGMDDKADAAYEQALAKPGRSAVTLTRYAFFLERTNRRDKLLEMCHAYLERFPDDARANEHYGIALYRQGDYEASIAPLRKAAATPAQAVESLSLLGNAYQKLGRHEDAIETWKGVLALSDSFDAKQVLYDMGMAYRALARTDQAIDIFMQHLQLFPHSSWTLQALHDLYAARGSEADAARMRVLREKLTPPMPIDRMLEPAVRVLGMDEPAKSVEAGSSFALNLYFLFLGSTRGRALPELQFWAAAADAAAGERPVPVSPTRLGPGPCFRGDVLIESFALTIPPDLTPGRQTVSVEATPGSGRVLLCPIEVVSSNKAGGT